MKRVLEFNLVESLDLQISKPSKAKGEVIPSSSQKKLAEEPELWVPWFPVEERVVTVTQYCPGSIWPAGIASLGLCCPGPVHQLIKCKGSLGQSGYSGCCSFSYYDPFFQLSKLLFSSNIVSLKFLLAQAVFFLTSPSLGGLSWVSLETPATLLAACFIFPGVSELGLLPWTVAFHWAFLPRFMMIQ